MVLVLLVLQQLLLANSQYYAPICTGLDVDGNDDDWNSCDSTGSDSIDMVQVGLPGSMALRESARIRFAHDHSHMYMLLQIRANYYLNLTAGNSFSHSMAVMWQVGPNATMFDMGGCTPAGYTGASYDCDAIKLYCATNNCSCDSYMTDVWHMESASPGSIPGVQYPLRSPVVFPKDGSYQSYAYNPDDLGSYQPGVERFTTGNDHTSNSDDEFSVHPCLRGDDGQTGAHLSDYRLSSQRYANQLKYAWSHSAINTYAYPFASPAADGWYTYEFSRPLYSTENTDVQFQIGSESSFAVAFWTPNGDLPWGDSDHYVAPASFQFATVYFIEESTPEQSVGNSGNIFKPYTVLGVLVLAAVMTVIL